MDYDTIALPESCYVDFCLLPVSFFTPPLPPQMADVTFRLALRAYQSPKRFQRFRKFSRRVGWSTRFTLLVQLSVRYFLPWLSTWVCDYFEHLLMILYSTEGPWDKVMEAVGKAHAVVHRRGVVRIQSSMRVGSRWVLYTPIPIQPFSYLPTYQDR